MRRPVIGVACVYYRRAVGVASTLNLDTVDQPPQRDADPARHLLPLDAPDVVRDFRGDIASQPDGVADGQVSGETVYRPTGRG